LPVAATLAARSVLLDVGACEPLEHGRQQDQIDQRRVELLAAPSRDDLDGGVEPLTAAIPSVVRQRIERVGDRHDARGEWNALATQVTRVAAPVPPLVVGQDSIWQLGIERGERRQHVRAAARVRGDLASLCRGEARRIVDDVEQRLVDLADVVKQRHALYRAALTLGQAGRVGDDQSIRRNPTDVLPGLRVVGLDGVENRFQARSREAFDGLASSAFTIGQHAGDDGRGEGDRAIHREELTEWRMPAPSHILGRTLVWASPVDQGRSMRSRINDAVSRPLAMACLLGLIAGQPACLAAQSAGTLLGVVVDSATRATLSGAEVSALALRQVVQTDERGRFTLTKVPAGEVELSIRRVGYEPQRETIIGTGGSRDSVLIVLVARPAVLSEVAVSAVGRHHREGIDGFYARRARGIGAFVTREDLESRHARVPTDALNLPGVALVPTRFGTAVRFTTGASLRRNCAPTLWVDGQRAPNMELDEIPVDDIEGIELYHGASVTPGQFWQGNTTSTTCGTIVVWSRTPGN
jgi:hypothetical protein